MAAAGRAKAPAFQAAQPQRAIRPFVQRDTRAGRLGGPHAPCTACVGKGLRLESTLLIAGLSLGIRFITGQLLAPWLTSHTSRLNPVAVFIGILFWGWLWGVWGMLLGVPILMIVKVFCDSVKGLHPAGELLGN